MIKELSEVRIPNIGIYKNIPIIEILVKPGDTVQYEQSLVILEADKTTIEIPSPYSGIIDQIKVKVGDIVSADTIILTILKINNKIDELDNSTKIQENHKNNESFISNSSPSVLKFARNLGINLNDVKGTGRNSRITQEDIAKFAKKLINDKENINNNINYESMNDKINYFPLKKIDFSKFGPINKTPISKFKKIVGQNLYRNWITIPHVTNHDDADITNLEKFRLNLNKEYEKQNIKFTILSFIIKACVSALKKFPNFNSTFDVENLILKQYYNIGFAVNTSYGIIVPVIPNIDKKNIIEIVKEKNYLSNLAKSGNLKSEQTHGGCFSISSLGRDSGRYFTPIINSPEVAILGISSSFMKLLWDGKKFVPRLMLPISLSYDHRVIDGVEASKFNKYLISILSDFRRIIL